MNRKRVTDSTGAMLYDRDANRELRKHRVAGGLTLLADEQMDFAGRNDTTVNVADAQLDW